MVYLVLWNKLSLKLKHSVFMWQNLNLCEERVKTYFTEDIDLQTMENAILALMPTVFLTPTLP